MTEVDQHIGEKIRWLRQARSLSLDETANAIGISWQMLQKYEQGRCRLGVARLHALAKFYSAPISFIIEQESITAADLDLLKVRGTAEILEIYTSIGEKGQRERILDFVQTVARSMGVRLRGRTDQMPG
ncbi:helix-turn-helix domain-containing protein [Methylobacterium dankookense]|uniref:helix-turn-helix domain-containing protein n=1 Tax=Methylobacterium dankookense TaxID=560405 RepID=UPI00119E8B37|nr:helix-turn-helix transcriptional regulator [Methylobacterium dankookense]